MANLNWCPHGSLEFSGDGYWWFCRACKIRLWLEPTERGEDNWRDYTDVTKRKVPPPPPKDGRKVVKNLMLPLCVVKNESIYVLEFDVKQDGTVDKEYATDKMDFYYRINIKCGENWENKFTDNKLNYLKGFLEDHFAPNKLMPTDGLYTFDGEEYIELKGKAKDDWEKLTELDYEEYRPRTNSWEEIKGCG